MHIVLRVLGVVVLGFAIVGLAAFGRSLFAGSANSDAGAIPTDSAPTTVVMQEPATQAPTGGAVRLDPEEVASWCADQVGRCQDHQFDQLVESCCATINPAGVHMTTGLPVTLTLPAGVAADVWFCFPPARTITGPANLEGVCEASIRRFS